MNPKTGIRVVTLAITALVTALIGGLLLRLTHNESAAAASLGWVGIVVMLFLGGGLLVAGWQVKQTRDGETERPVSALRAARTLVLGQAGALTGAALVGWYGIQSLLVLPNLDVPSQRNALWLLLGHLVAALALTGCGLLVQTFCRLRPGGGEDENGHNRDSGDNRSGAPLDQ